MQNRMIKIIFLVLAISCYAVGLLLPATLFLFVGATAETLFWFRLLRRRRRAGPA